MWSSAAGFHGGNERAKRLRHSGVQVGELIGYRAWRSIELGRWLGHDDRLRSVLISDYVWDPDKPASGDVEVHGIYSFRKAIRSMENYGRTFGRGPLLFGKVKIWGEVVEHEWGYRSQ